MTERLVASATCCVPVQRVSRHEARLEALEAERRARHADPAADARLLSAIASRFGSAVFTVGDLRRGAAVDADLAWRVRELVC